MASRGKRAGARKKPAFRLSVLLLAMGVTLGVVAWGYLVKAAIDFGVQARAGTPGAWVYLGLACLGAVACLFVGLMLVARLLRELGITSGPSRSEPRTRGGASSPSRPVGGRRAAR